jgi:hypothetical protein
MPLTSIDVLHRLRAASDGPIENRPADAMPAARAAAV